MRDKKEEVLMCDGTKDFPFCVLDHGHAGVHKDRDGNIPSEKHDCRTWCAVCQPSAFDAHTKDCPTLTRKADRHAELVDILFEYHASINRIVSQTVRLIHGLDSPQWCLTSFEARMTEALEDAMEKVRLKVTQ